MKEFLNKKVVQVTEFVILALSSAGLILGGQSAEGISSVVTSVSAGIAALAAIVALIRGLVNKDNKDEIAEESK